MKTINVTVESKAKENIANLLSPQAFEMIKDLAETVKPLLDEVHSLPKVSKDYYFEYMSILGRATQGKPQGYLKLMAIAMLYAGCNHNGVNEAVKILSN